MRREQLLLLEYPSFSEKVGSFLERLDTDQTMRELFIRDPGTILAHSVFTELPRPPAAVINQGNRLMFALLSNDGFMAWADGYSERLSNAAIDAYPRLNPEEAALAHAATLNTDDVYAEVIEAALANVDRELLAALLVIDAGDVDTLLDTRVLEPGARTAMSLVVVVIFVAIAVVIAAVALNHHVAKAEVAGMSREDLSRVSRLMIDGLTQHAHELRAAGVLATPRSAAAGTKL